MAHVANQEVRSRTGQPPVISLVKLRRLKLFGHIAQAEPAQDHARKYLGITVRDSLDFSCHVAETVTKANKRLGFLKRN